MSEPLAAKVSTPQSEFTRSSQVASRILFHSSMMASRSWWMLETLCSSSFCLAMPHRWSIGYRSGDMLGQSITFTLSFSHKAGLCFSMSEYMLAFTVPSMNCSTPVPAALMQPQTMTIPPPCLTVGKTYLSLNSSPGCRHTRLTPSEPKKFILVSSLFAGFLVHHLWKRLPSGNNHADQFDAVCSVCFLYL